MNVEMTAVLPDVEPNPERDFPGDAAMLRATPLHIETNPSSNKIRVNKVHG
jgi:hypothetical protein